MSDDLTAVVRDALSGMGGLPSAPALAVAVSGGADSMTLLSLCVALRAGGIIPSLAAIHINHQLRPAAETAADYRTVREYSAAHEVTLHDR